ncbi:hypothetical protein [Halorubrum distributum]|uniref:hypothetical protein n=1 Tax=Halorubrum distributum TaxID=29283 RepID=UPI001EF9D872|nr:hypothetical protein [Halorubrum distributum]
MDRSNDAGRLFCGGQPSVRDGVASDRVVSVLFGTNVEAWRSGWERRPAGPPTREAVVDVNGIARSGATASTQVVPNNGLAYTVLGRDAGSERVLDAVDDHLDGVPSGTVDVVIDDVAPVAARDGVDAAVAFADRLLGRFGDRANRVAIGCSFEGSAELLSRVGGRVDAVVGADADATAAVERLSRDDPTTFGYVRRHWVEAKRGIETCDRNYPQSKQVHAALTDPETTPRTLGATLSGLVTLGALETWGDTVGPTRYDLTAYRPERTLAVGAALEAYVSEE